MKLFDSHCHLDDRVYHKDFQSVMERMAQAGVVRAMVVGIDVSTSERAVSMAQAMPGLYASVGVHPHNAQTCSDAALARLVALSRTHRVRAWGETGLDFNRNYSPRKDQERWFVRQLDMAAERGLPVILHERDSGGRLLAILTAHAAQLEKGGVVHCFSGSEQELKRYLDLGLHIGVTGIVTLKDRGRALRRMVLRIPADRILIETDAPYLTPAPEKNRYRRNEPAFVRSVLLKLAQVRGEDTETLAAAVWENTCRLYGIR